MDTKILRSKILDLAIRGKLVEQDAADGCALDLLAQIGKERGCVIKPLTEDVPFEIPENWCWVNVSDITKLISTRDLQIKSSEILVSGKYPVVSQGQNIIDGYSNHEDKVCTEFPIVLFGDHTRNVKYIDFPFVVGADGTKLHRCIGVHDVYFYDWMQWAAERITNRGYERHYSLIKSTPVPLPPLAVQKRIVAKVEELLAEVDQIEKAQSDIADASAILRSRVLDLAIRGKLVEQDAADGSALDLLAQIGKERGCVIKPLTEDVPFDIPENWRWVKLGDVVQAINGDRGENYPSKKSLSPQGDVPFISAINMQDNTVCEENLLYLARERYELLRSGKLQKNDVVLCIRGSLGKCCIYPFESGAIASSLVILRTYVDLNNQYLLSYIKSSLFTKEIRKYDNGTAQPNLAAGDLKKFLIPLPPLAEQKRIVAKVEELLADIDKLK